MTTMGEEFTDGLPKCECGCTNVVVEMTTYLFVNRNEDLAVVSEIEGDEQDIKFTCRNCENELEV